jgi:hypothetical protein
MLRNIFASAALLSVLALMACSAKTTGANSSSSAGDTASTTPAPSAAGASATAANAPLYPDLARAVAPPYPNATLGMLVNTGLYQFQSTDDLATASAWYKAHVSAAWTADATDGAQSATVNGVRISVSKISGPSGGAGSAKTMIELSHL